MKELLTSYLPGEGGSYYAWQDSGVWCAFASTWHLLMYWTGSGWASAGQWSCF